MEKGLCGKYPVAIYCTFCEDRNCKFNVKNELSKIIEELSGLHELFLYTAMIMAIKKCFEKRRNEINESGNNTEHKSGD